jgi:hypothetical protein
MFLGEGDGELMLDVNVHQTLILYVGCKKNTCRGPSSGCEWCFNICVFWGCIVKECLWSLVLAVWYKNVLTSRER